MKRIFLISVLFLIAASPSPAAFTTIQSSGSAEPSLFEVLDIVAPKAGGWLSTAYLNSGAGGRRVDDSLDQIWKDGIVTVTATGLFWGGGAAPGDTNGQDYVWDNNLDGSSPSATGVDITTLGSYPGSSFVATTFIMGDDSNTGLAWSLDSLNGGVDRMISFDVSGLNIYAWTAGDKTNPTTSLLATAIEGPAYIVAFDPGSDSDYQDMLILVEGAQPIPVPAALFLGAAGAGFVGWLRRRKAL